jgi:gamma-polyglutamate biosynthesis protein CapC
MTTLYFCIGITVGLLFFEFSGIVPGGIIVPGYIALFINQPLRILATVTAALIALAAGRILLKWISAYGKLRFGMFILLGIGANILMEYLIFNIRGFPLGMQSIGIIIPGIIANEMERQGTGLTLLGLGIVSVLLYLIILLLPQGLII